jgi:hypothetical protein
MSAYTFTPVLPHGDIQEIVPDVFFVTGTSCPTFQGQKWQFSRNMTIVRQGDALTLINTVRLDDAGLQALDQLGKVKNVVKIGAFHGIDDAFYVDRYRARLWALPGHQHESGLPTDETLTSGGKMPFSGCSLFVFETAKMPEGILLIDRDGGILVACDSLQNWVDADQYFSEASAEMMRQIGFIRPANVGPGWQKFCEPQASDFIRLKALPFRHLLSAHGVPLRNDAHAQLSATFAGLFGV